MASSYHHRRLAVPALTSGFADGPHASTYHSADTWQMATAFAVLFTLYPRSGDRQLTLLPFNHRIEAAKDIMEMALMGDSITINNELLNSTVWEDMAFLQLLALGLFFLAYAASSHHNTVLSLGATWITAHPSLPVSLLTRGRYVFFILLSVILLLNLLIAMLTHTFVRHRGTFNSA